MNKQQFSDRVRRMEAKLYRVARTLLPCDADCMDATQEALIKAWTRLGSLRDEERFEAWLIRILINECRQVYRRSRARICEAWSDSIAAPKAPDPMLHDALMRLHEKYRLPLVLHHLEGYGVEEIAEILKLPAGTVKSRLHYGRKRLGAELGKEADE